MQGRMKRHQLSKEEIADLLLNKQVGRIVTVNENGYPYIVPVHFVFYEGWIYIHGLIKGQKISNLLRNDKVGFEIDEMGAIIPDKENVCDTNTTFKSVIILGTAKMIDDITLKISVLQFIVNKYTPELSHLKFPDKMMKATGIIEIQIKECTGKYYK